MEIKQRTILHYRPKSEHQALKLQLQDQSLSNKKLLKSQRVPRQQLRNNSQPTNQKQIRIDRLEGYGSQADLVNKEFSYSCKRSGDLQWFEDVIHENFKVNQIQEYVQDKSENLSLKAAKLQGIQKELWEKNQTKKHLQEKIQKLQLEIKEMRAQLQLSKKAYASYHQNLLQTKSSNYKIHNEGIAIVKESESLEKTIRQYMSELQQIAETQELSQKQIEIEKEKVQELREICSKLKEEAIIQTKMRDQIRTKIGNHQKVFEQLREKVRLNSIKNRITASNLETIQSQFKLFNQIMSLDSSGISIFEEVKEIDPNNERQNNKAQESSSERRLSVKELVQSFNSQINQTTEASKKDQQFYRDLKQKQNKSVDISSNEISVQENKNTVLKSNFQDLNEYEQKQETGFENQSVETFVNKQDSNPSEAANDQIGQYKQQYQDKQYNDFPIEKIALLDLHNKSLTHQNENLNDQFNQLQTQLKDLNLKIQQMANQNNKLVQDNEQVASEIQQAVIERDQAIGEKYALLQQLGQYMEKQYPGTQLSPEEVSQQYQGLISKYASLEEKFVQSKLENNNLKRQIEDMQDQFEQQQQVVQVQKQTIQGLRETLEQNIKKISQHQKKTFKPVQPQNLNQSFSGDPFSYVRNNTEEVESTEQRRQNQLEIQQERKVNRGEKEAASQEIQSKMQSSIMRTNQIQPDITKQRISKLFGSFDK